MDDKTRPSFIGFFSSIEDPRIDRRKLHLLEDILAISILSVICGAEGWEDIETFGNMKFQWLQTFLKLPNGIPSHDTIRRVFERIEPQQFRKCFSEWINSVQKITAGEVIAIDGKTLRRSFDKAAESQAIHMVSAWACTNGVVLGQLKVAEKSNEIKAIPRLLETLCVSGCIVTIDAMGTQKEIAKQIIEHQGDYVLASQRLFSRKLCCG